MADEQFFEIPLGNIGMEPLAPERSMGANALYDLCNLTCDYGGLRRRPALIRGAFGPATYTHPLAESPIAFETFPVVGGVATCVMVTTRSLYHRNTSGTWADVTPTYSTGTVSITTGTTALTGAGTTWQTGGATGVSVAAEMTVLLQGTWYRIASCTGNGAIALASNYLGTNLVGAAYTIKLNWNLETGGGDTFSPVRAFIKRSNGDVYVCGSLAQDRNTAIGGGITLPFGAVLKIASGADYGAIAVNPATYVITGVLVQFGTGVASTALGYTWVPYGFDVLEDGRLLMVVHWVGNGALSGAGVARLVYSSNLNVSVWNVSPGGFTDISMKQGAITGLFRLGRTRCIHFTDGIVNGEPTGQDDPPLSFYDTKASVGAIGPWACIPLSGGQTYVGYDGNLRSFNGDVDAMVSDSFRRLVVTNNSSALQEYIGTISGGIHLAIAYSELTNCQMLENKYRGEIRVLYVGATSSFHHTNEVVFNYRTGKLSRYFHYGKISVAIQGLLPNGIGGGGAPQPGKDELWYAGPSRDSSLTLQPNNFYRASANEYQDTAYSTWADPDFTACYWLVTDVLDFGTPNSVKAITRVGVIAEECDFSASDTAGITVSILTERGDPFQVSGGPTVVATQTQAVWWTASAYGRQVKWFTFPPVSVSTGYRIRVQTADATQPTIVRWRLLKIIVGYVVTGDVRTLNP